MQAVAWLPARGDLLLALFALLTLASFIKVIASGGWRNYLAHGIFFTLAIFSKESAVVLPLLLGLYLWAYGKTAALRRAHLCLPLFYLAVEAFFFRLKSLSVVLYNGDIGVVPLLKNMRTLPETVAKFHLPLNISTLPAYKPGATGAGILIISALTAVYLLFRERFDRRVSFYCGWLLLFMVPGMLYYPVFYYFAYEHVDHRAYTSCFGLLLLILNAVQVFELDKKRYFAAACLLLLLYLAALNSHFSENYRNPANFGLRAIMTNPRSAYGYAIYGTELYLAGKDDEALANLNRSIRIFRKNTPALHTRVLIYRKRGMNREALADLDTIIAMHPESDAEDYLQRARTRIDLEDYDGAARDYGVALKLRPGDEEAAKGLHELKRTASGNRLLPHVRAARQYNQQGVEAGERGDFKGAEALFRRALATDPGFYGVNLNLGRALYEQGRVAEACKAWRVGEEHDPGSAEEQLREYCGR